MAATAAVEKKYQKKDLRTHVYDRPGVYIGSDVPDTITTFVINDAGTRAAEKEVTYVPGLLKLFDEILSNARDHFIRLRQAEAKATADGTPLEVHHVRAIHVKVDRATGVIEVLNDGDGIDVVQHPEYKVYVPELVFANLLTSTNYDDTEQREVVGTNGVGSKAVNIFSTEFYVETLDAHRSKLYTQSYHGNMTKIDPPKIKSVSVSKYPYTLIRFHPDYARFTLAGITDDMYRVFRKRTYDLAASMNGNVAVSFNGEKLPVKSFERYADLFLGPKADHDRVYFATPDGRWEVVASFNDADGGMRQVSMVNGSVTGRGGTHVTYVANQIVTKLLALVKKRSIKAQIVRDNLFLFVNATIINPRFDSQTKETLITLPAAFGSACALPDDFVKKLAKTGLMDRVIEFADFLDSKKLAKTDGKKKTRITVPKLDDANKAGTKDSHLCTLILTEGDSAKTFAISGLSVVGRDLYGVFPLRGKLLNVRDTAAAKILANVEITALKQIIGLKGGVDYEKEGIDSLRYGHVMLLTDQDHDGSHIKGLLMNMFDSLYPSLLKRDGFLVSMLTPIVKVTRAPDAKNLFYNMTDYERWAKAHHGEKGWTHKYLKGLGTSTAKEAKEYFGDMRMMRYTYTGKASDDALDLAFNSKRANDRKAWLMKYDPDVTLDYAVANPDVTFDAFVQKDLIHYSNRDLERSIPSVVDGLKESIRKILYACFKRKLFTGEVKVAQLSGYVSENAAYHHGEASLQEAIVGMAQTYVGSGNNINLLSPNGQFGTRIQGGKDHASARYIFTVLSKAARAVFRPEDNPVLDYLEDDGDPCEPTFYVPVIPFVLCNGAAGIGTGFSTTVTCHNPEDLIALCVGLIDALAAAGAKLEEEDDMADVGPAVDKFRAKTLEPWFRGFTGRIEDAKSYGVVRRLAPEGGGARAAAASQARVEIRELPLGTWTEDYKDMLEDPEWAGNKRGLVRDFVCGKQHTETSVQFEVRLTPDGEALLADEAKFVDVFKLSSSKLLSTGNMHLYSADRHIERFDTTSQIFRAFAKVRLLTYVKRKRFDVKALGQELRILDARARFIGDVCDHVVKVMNTPAKEVAAQLRGAKPPYPLQHEEEGAAPPPPPPDEDAADADAEDAEDAEDDVEQAGGAARVPRGSSVAVANAAAAEAAGEAAVKGFGYLLSMPISTLTREKKLRLEVESAALRKRLDDLKRTSVLEIWRRELGELTEVLKTSVAV